RAAQRVPLQRELRLTDLASHRPRVCRRTLVATGIGEPRRHFGGRMTERMPQGGLPLVLLTGNGQETTRWLRSLLEGGGYAVLQERSVSMPSSAPAPRSRT